MSLRVRALGCTLVALAACGGDDTAAWLMVGAGETRFVELRDGDHIEVVLGFQGGHMLLLALRAGGVVAGDPGDPTDSDNPRVTYSAFAVDTEQILGVITEQRGLVRQEDEFELVGAALIFNPALDTSLYFDRDLRIEIALVDKRGVEVRDSVTVTTDAPTRTLGLLDLHVDPGEVVRSANDDPECPSREVGGAQGQDRSFARPNVRPGAEVAALVRGVATVAARLVIDAEYLDRLSVSHQRELVTSAHPRIVDPSEMEKHVAGQRTLQGVGPLDQRPLAQDELVSVRNLVAVLGHAEATVGVGRGGRSLHVHPMPPGAFERRSGALLVDGRALTDCGRVGTTSAPEREHRQSEERLAKHTGSRNG